MDHSSKIESFLLGELHGEEREALLKAMEEDPALKLEVERQGKLMAMLEGMRLRDHVRKNKAGALRRGRSVRLLWLSVAAACALLVVAMLWMYKTDREDQAKHAPKPGMEGQGPPIAPNEDRATEPPASGDPVREIPPPEDGPKEMMVHAQVEELYHAELSRFDIPEQELMGEEGTDANGEAELRRALRSMREQRPSDALRILERMQDGSAEWYRDDVQWLIALCHLRLEYGKGVGEMDAIAGDPAHEYRLRAVQLLGKLKQ